MKVTVYINKHPNNNINIRMILDDEYSTVLDHDSNNMFPSIERHGFNYYKNLVDNKIIEDSKSYVVNNNFLNKLKSVKNVISFERIFIANEEYVKEDVSDDKDNVNQDTIHSVLCNDTILYDKYNNKKYTCDFVEKENDKLYVYNFKYLNFLILGNYLFESKFIRKHVPYCVDITKANDCYELNRVYSYIGIINHKTLSYLKERIYVYDDNSKPTTDIISLITAINEYYSILNTKNLKGSCDLSNIIDVIKFYYSNKINECIPVPDYTVEVPKYSPIPLIYLSLKEELIQKIFHPTRLIHYLEDYEYDIGECY